MADKVPVRATVPHVERLAEVLTVLTRESISLELGTFWAKARDAGASPVGCALGHYAWIAKPPHLQVVPINFLEQLKAPIVAGQVLAKYPSGAWQHHTLHYSGPEVEAWGLSAACLYFRLRPWDCQRLFWPVGSNYQLELGSEPIARRLEMFLRTAKPLEED